MRMLRKSQAWIATKTLEKKNTNPIELKSTDNCQLSLKKTHYIEMNYKNQRIPVKIKYSRGHSDRNALTSFKFNSEVIQKTIFFH